MMNLRVALLAAFLALAAPRAAVEGVALTSSSARVAGKLRATTMAALLEGRSRAQANANTNASSALLGGSLAGKGKPLISEHGKAPLGDMCMVGSACGSRKCRLGVCSKNCKSELGRCYCDKHDERCDECCGDLPYCWQSGINAHKICNRRPKQELTPGQWWGAAWKGVVDSINVRGKHLTFDYRMMCPQCVNNIEHQGSCSSCWAFAAATAAQYRMCRGFDELSQMDILCNQPADTANDNLCAGGWPRYGLNFIASHGVLSRKDFEYPFSASFLGSISRSQCDAAPPRGEGTRYKFTRGTHYYDDPETRGYNFSAVDGQPGESGFPWDYTCEQFGVTPGCAKKHGGLGCYCDTHSAFRTHCAKSCGPAKAPFRYMNGKEAYFNEKVKYALRAYGPAPVGVQMYNDWDFHTSDPACWAPGGGIPMSRQHDKSCCYKNRGGIFTNKEDRGWCDGKTKNAHAMVITGWGTMNGVGYWQIENSWGASFAFGGEVRIAMDYLRPEDASSDLSVTVSLPEDWRPL